MAKDFSVCFCSFALLKREVLYGRYFPYLSLILYCYEVGLQVSVRLYSFLEGALFIRNLSGLAALLVVSVFDTTNPRKSFV